ncbi:unnamed protein product [Effrenium voratum]|nr:unnamed protein product [Effrenium voratum]
MGFSAWAKEQVRASLPQCFLVDNTELGSSSSGLRFRNSPSHEDLNLQRKPVPWESLVWGSLEADGAWVKVKEGRYLPVFNASGVRVLQQIEVKGEQEEKVEADSMQLGQIQAPLHISPGAGTQPDEEVGAWYQVVAERVALRQGPSLGAMVLGQLLRGQQLEMFGWDESRLWRRCADHRLSRTGWVLLDHPDLGPLVRPLGEPLCSRPLNVLAVAASEGRLEDLEAFLEEERDFQDPRGHALVLAFTKSQLRASLRLLRALGPEVAQKLQPLPWRLQAFKELAHGQDLGVFSEEELQQLLRLRLDALELEATAEKAAEAAEAKGPTEAPEEAPAPEPVLLGSSVTLRTTEPGDLYEVVYSAVWIRRAPFADAARVSKRIQGQRLRILDYDESRLWGHVVFKTSEGMDEGWMLIQHDDLGQLLKPVEDDGGGFLVRPESAP